ncbi:MAG: hypothetical protein Q9M91_02765 [Candidatus Dojkabacteria bacterium]|nr:hypothetical protein [Candidatus Dojkabacteria bacterium]MDQ7020746.1 hypothetical protein [Candidatus Dojkabacteria bacterium]
MLKDDQSSEDSSANVADYSCTALYQPVCETDGVTYSNSCMAGASTVSIECLSECPCGMDIPSEISPLISEYDVTETITVDISAYPDLANSNGMSVFLDTTNINIESL